MAKSDNSEGKKNDGKDPREALRDAAQKASDLAKNPVARSMLAAGLVTAAAALTANKKVRDKVKGAGREAQEAADAATENAGKIGAAIVNAATDAIRRLFGDTDAPEQTLSSTPAGGARARAKTSNKAKAKPKADGAAKAGKASGRAAATKAASSASASESPTGTQPKTKGRKPAAKSGTKAASARKAKAASPAPSDGGGTAGPEPKRARGRKPKAKQAAVTNGDGGNAG